MEIRKTNFAWTDPKCSDGDTFVECNLCQHTPGTVICKGVKGLQFVRCNLVNVALPDGAKAVGCNTSQRSFCSHLHPKLVARGLAECPVDCEHRDGADKQWAEIGEKEFRQVHNSLDIAKPEVRVVKADDDDGVTQQTFEKLVYSYSDRRATQ